MATISVRPMNGSGRRESAPEIAMVLLLLVLVAAAAMLAVSLRTTHDRADLGVDDIAQFGD